MESIKELYKNEKTSFLLIISGLALATFGLVTFFWLESTLDLDKKIDSSKFGQFGDFIGGVVGSLWALAGVILFYKALKAQQSDTNTNRKNQKVQTEALQLQIKEFELQRNELISTRKVYEEQSKTLRVQQFESNFYSLLNVYLKIKNDLNRIDENGDFFRGLCQHFEGQYTVGANPINHLEGMINKYNYVFNTHRGHLSHYFKCFYRIVKIIDSDTTFSFKEQFFYSKILRSQLTDYEQLFLSYNAHSIYATKSRPLILKYNLLKHVPSFSKPEFSHFQSVQNGTDLIHFSYYINEFLIRRLPVLEDLSSETEKAEENCRYFDCIVGLYAFDSSIELKVHCKKLIANNGINLSEDQFLDFLFFLVYDKVVFSNYIDSSQIIITKSKTESDDSKIFGIKIKSNQSILPPYDKY